MDYLDHKSLENYFIKFNLVNGSYYGSKKYSTFEMYK